MLVEGRTVWEFAMAMAVHIHNLSFRSGVNDLPPKLLTITSPDPLLFPHLRLSRVRPCPES
jgi:hypothetical protein